MIGTTIKNLCLFWQYRPKEPTHHLAKRIYVCCVVAAVIFFLLLVYVAWTLVARKSTIRVEAIETGKTRIAKITTQVEQLVNSVEKLTGQLASDLQQGRLKRDLITERLEKDATQQGMLFGLGVAYEPQTVLVQRELEFANV